MRATTVVEVTDTLTRIDVVGVALDVESDAEATDSANGSSDLTMRIGVPKEIKCAERRVGLTPDSMAELASRGHEMFIERGAGIGAGFRDDEYESCGASLVDSADALFGTAEMIVKVKELQPVELPRLRSHHILVAFLHLAPDPDQAKGLLASGATAIAYESVVGPRGGLPLLTPMSQVAGRMSIQAGAACLEASSGGRGVLLGGVPGVPPASVTVIGGGVVGRKAVEMAVGLGACVTVLDRDPGVLRQLADRFGPAVHTVYSNTASLEAAVIGADLVVGAVLVRGAKTPHLVKTTMVEKMRSGSAIVDVAIDQGGCSETSRPTTHTDPIYEVDGVVHYCVANMPGAVPRTSTQALNNATLPYLLRLADSGPAEAMRSDSGLRAGLTVHAGRITEPVVAAALGVSYSRPRRSSTEPSERIWSRWPADTWRSRIPFPGEANKLGLDKLGLDLVAQTGGT